MSDFIFSKKEKQVDTISKGSVKTESRVSEGPLLDKNGNVFDINAPVQKSKKKQNINLEKKDRLIQEINKPMSVEKCHRIARDRKIKKNSPRYVGLEKKFSITQKDDQPKMRAVRERLQDYYAVLEMDEEDQLAGVPMALNNLIQACNAYSSWRFPFKWGRGKKRLNEVKALRQMAIAELERLRSEAGKHAAGEAPIALKEELSGDENLVNNIEESEEERIHREDRKAVLEIEKQYKSLKPYSEITEGEEEENESFKEEQEIEEKTEKKEEWGLTEKELKSLSKITKKGKFSAAQKEAGKKFALGMQAATDQSLGQWDEFEKGTIKKFGIQSIVDCMFVDGKCLQVYVREKYNYHVKKINHPTPEEREVLNCYAAMISLRQNHVINFVVPQIKDGKVNTRYIVPPYTLIFDKDSEKKKKKAKELKDKAVIQKNKLKKEFPKLNDAIMNDYRTYLFTDRKKDIVDDPIDNDKLTEVQKKYVQLGKRELARRIKESVKFGISDGDIFNACGYSDLIDTFYVDGLPLAEYLEKNCGYKKNEDNLRADEELRYAWLFKIMGQKQLPLNFVLPTKVRRDGKEKIAPIFYNYGMANIEPADSAERMYRKEKKELEAYKKNPEVYETKLEEYKTKTKAYEEKIKAYEKKTKKMQSELVGKYVNVLQKEYDRQLALLAEYR